MQWAGLSLIPGHQPTQATGTAGGRVSWPAPPCSISYLSKSFVRLQGPPTRNRGLARRPYGGEASPPNPKLHLNNCSERGGRTIPMSQSSLQPREEKAGSVICFNNPAELGEN